jgi:hypothetical protein
MNTRHILDLSLCTKLVEIFILFRRHPAVPIVVGLLRAGEMLYNIGYSLGSPSKKIVVLQLLLALSEWHLDTQIVPNTILVYVEKGCISIMCRL